MDAVVLLNKWLATQCRLLGDGLVQLAGSPLAMMTPWLGLQGELTQQFLTLAAQTMQQMREADRDDKATDANAWAASSAALSQPWQRTLGDWWPQWSAFWMRGMEQLA
ncbi:MAG TPA: hypothetical protein VFV25_11265 [Methylibium sp.]